MPVPIGTKTLVLNSDWMPMNVVSWKKGITRTLLEVTCEHCRGTGTIREGSHRAPCPYCHTKGYLIPAEAMEFYDFTVQDSMGRQYLVPAVVRNQTYVNRVFKRVPFSRPNIFKRDNHTCQYCGKKMGPAHLTMDHVVPRSVWSGNDTPTCWHNIVTSCKKCNGHKDARTPEQAGMTLRKKLANGQTVTYKRPKQATHTELVLGLTGTYYPPEWDKYVQSILSSKKFA